MARKQKRTDRSKIDATDRSVLLPLCLTPEQVSQARPMSHALYDALPVGPELLVPEVPNGGAAATFAGAPGAVGTILATNVSRIGSLLEIANKLINAFTGPLFGIYLLAMFSRRATSESVLTGGVAGSFVSYYVAYHTRIGFLWPSAFGLAATVVIASIMTVVIDVELRELAQRGSRYFSSLANTVSLTVGRI